MLWGNSQGQPLDIPDEITNLSGTISSTKYALDPRQAFSPLNDAIVTFNEYNIKKKFGTYNGMLAINGELAGWWDVDSFLPSQYELIMGHKLIGNF